MAPENESDPREAAAREERNSKILEAAEALKIPGRGFDSQPEFAGAEKRQVIKQEDGRPDGWVIKNEHGQDVVREAISYARQKKEGTEHQWDNTDAVEKMSQAVSEYDDRGQKIRERGQDLNAVNGWERDFSYDEQGRLSGEKGRITEGEKVGEEWENAVTFETKGDYTKKIRSNAGKHFVNGELVPFKAIKVNYSGPDGKDFLYRSREYDVDGNELPDKNMDWQAEGSLPPDFQEW